MEKEGFLEWTEVAVVDLDAVEGELSALDDLSELGELSTTPGVSSFFGVVGIVAGKTKGGVY